MWNIRLWNRPRFLPDTNELNRRIRSLENGFRRPRRSKRPRLLRYAASKTYKLPESFTEAECDLVGQALVFPERYSAIDSRIGHRIRWLRGGGRWRSHKESIEYEGVVLAIVKQGEKASEYVEKYFHGQKLASCNKNIATQNDRFLIRLDSGRWALLAFNHATYELVQEHTERTHSAPPRKWLRRPGI